MVAGRLADRVRSLALNRGLRGEVSRRHSQPDLRRRGRRRQRAPADRGTATSARGGPSARNSEGQPLRPRARYARLVAGRLELDLPARRAVHFVMNADGTCEQPFGPCGARARRRAAWQARLHRRCHRFLCRQPALSGARRPARRGASRPARSPAASARGSRTGGSQSAGEAALVLRRQASRAGDAPVRTTAVDVLQVGSTSSSVRGRHSSRGNRGSDVQRHWARVPGDSSYRLERQRARAGTPVFASIGLAADSGRVLACDVVGTDGSDRLVGTRPATRSRPWCGGGAVDARAVSRASRARARRAG